MLHLRRGVFFVLNNKHQMIRQGKTSGNLIKSQQIFSIEKFKLMTTLFWNVVPISKNILGTKGR